MRTIRDKKPKRNHRLRFAVDFSLYATRFFKRIVKRVSFDTPRAKRKIIKYYKVNLYGLHIVRPRAVTSASHGEKRRMKKVIVAIQNTLVCEAVTCALKKAGFFVEQSLSQDPDKIATACETFFVDVLLMDVGRPTEKSLDRRMEAILRSKKKNTTMKAGLLCDNASDPEIAQKVKQAKENGFIDVFFYESVQTDYLCDVVDSL